MIERETSEDLRWVEGIDRSWRPSPLDDAGRTRFDARLHERLAARAPTRRAAWLAPAATGAVLAAALLWGVARPAPEARPVASEAELTAWEWELLLDDELSNGDGGASLPDEYAAIAGVFEIR